MVHSDAYIEAAAASVELCVKSRHKCVGLWAEVEKEDCGMPESFAGSWAWKYIGIRGSKCLINFVDGGFFFFGLASLILSYFLPISLIAAKGTAMGFVIGYFKW